MSELTGVSDTITAATETGMPATDLGALPGHGTRARDNRDVEAFIASEDHLLGPRAPQGVGATSGDLNGGQGAATGTGTDGTSISQPGAGTDASQRTDEGDCGASGAHASQAVATVDETPTVTPKSTDSSDGSSGDASATNSVGESDAAVDALLAKEDLLLGIFARSDEEADNGDDATANPGAGETTVDPPTGSDEPGPAGAQGHKDQVAEPDNGDAANGTQDGDTQDTGQPSGAPVRADSAGSDTRQEAAEAPGEGGRAQPDLPEAAPDQQPEGPQSVQALIAEQVAAVKAELKAEHDIELANFKSELADVKDALAQSHAELAGMKDALAGSTSQSTDAKDTVTQSGAEASSPKSKDRVTEPEAAEQGVLSVRSGREQNAEEVSHQSRRSDWKTDATLGVYGAAAGVGPAIAAAVIQPNAITIGAAVGTFVGTLTAGVVALRAHKEARHGN
jgi:hypothetical protein